MKDDFLNGLFGFSGKTVLVTGASGQLGTRIAETFLKAGARVYASDKDINSGKKISDEFIEYIKMDISDKASVTAVLDAVYSSAGKLDVLINNAGVSVFEPFEERHEESFDHVMDVNLKGTFFCIQAYVKKLRENAQKGNIVNIASLYGIVSPDPRIYTDCARKNSEVYGATKAGIIQMSKYFAVHLAGEGIRVNCVSPGGIFNPDSPQGEDFIKNYSHRCPMGRMAEADEMMGALLYLSSDSATYTTGQNVVIDGGTSCW
jgi:NAD(P)-dependent dehydrogenase (short-subunit alcohol dehydrogenase family)